MGQEVEVRPGVVTKDANGVIKCIPIRSRIISLFAEQNPLQYAAPGGLIGVGTTVDPTLTRADRLVGQVLGEVGALPDVFTELEINFFLLRRLLGVRTSGDEKQGKVRGWCAVPLLHTPAFLPSPSRLRSLLFLLLWHPPCLCPHPPLCTRPRTPNEPTPPSGPCVPQVSKLVKNEVLMLNIGSMCTGAKVAAVSTHTHTAPLTFPMMLPPRTHTPAPSNATCEKQTAAPCLSHLFCPLTRFVLGCFPLYSPGQARSGQAAAHQPGVHKGGREDCSVAACGQALAAHWLGADSEGAHACRALSSPIPPTPLVACPSVPPSQLSVLCVSLPLLPAPPLPARCSSPLLTQHCTLGRGPPPRRQLAPHELLPVMTRTCTCSRRRWCWQAQASSRKGVPSSNLWWLLSGGSPGAE